MLLLLFPSWMPAYRNYNNGWLLVNWNSSLIKLNSLFLVSRLNVRNSPFILLSILLHVIVVLLAILDHPCLLPVASTVPGLVTLIINIWQFLPSTPHSKSQSNTLAIVLLLVLPRFGMIFLMMYTVQHLLPPSGKKLQIYLLAEAYLP